MTYSYSIKDSHLYSILDEAMKGTLHRIELAAVAYLERIPITFPEFTTHGVDHSLNIIKALDTWLLDSEQKDYLEKHIWEAFFLIATAYLHDIGMIDHPKLQIPGNINSEKEKKAFIRENHHERSYIFILELWEKLGIEDEFQAEIIALCSLGHRKIPINDEKLSINIPYKSGTSINIQFVSSCIRLADELDLTFERAPHNIYEMLPEKDNTTILEWCKHLSIGGVAPHAYIPGTIHIRCRCKDLSVHMSLKKHEVKLQTMLNEINRYVRPKFLFSNVIYDINNDGYEAVDYRFIVDTTSALQLFMGENIYDDKRVFSRELIQNSLDACKTKQKFRNDYKPQIEIRTDLGDNIVSIQDNGIGMDMEWVQKYLLPVGISFYKSEELAKITGNIDLDISFIGRFGIGFLTTFMVSKRIIIKTKKENSAGLEITIDDPQSYMKIRKNENINPGTEVIIYLSKNDNRWDLTSWSFKSYLYFNFKHCHFEIKFVDFEGKTHPIGKELFDTKRNFIKSKKNPFKHSDLKVFLPVIRTKQKGIIGLAKIHGGVPIYQDGIFICGDDTLLNAGFKNKIGGRINFKLNERFNLSLDRNNIIWEKNQKKLLKDKILIGCIDVCNIYTEAIIAQKKDEGSKEQKILEIAKFFKNIYLTNINYIQIHPKIKRALLLYYYDEIIYSSRITFKKLTENYVRKLTTISKFKLSREILNDILIVVKSEIENNQTPLKYIESLDFNEIEDYRSICRDILDKIMKTNSLESIFNKHTLCWEYCKSHLVSEENIIKDYIIRYLNNKEDINKKEALRGKLSVDDNRINNYNFYQDLFSIINDEHGQGILRQGFFFDNIDWT